MKLKAIKGEVFIKRLGQQERKRQVKITENIFTDFT